MEKENILGLTEVEVHNQQKIFGKNIFLEKERQTAFFTFLSEFKSPLIIILIIAAIFSFVTGAKIEGSLIIFIVLASAILDFVVSFKSQKAAETLAKKVSTKASVLRDTMRLNIEVIELVPKDILFLIAGDIIPADGTILETKDLYINESSLTGESLPIQKNIQNDVYMGSGVVSGTATIVITSTGKHTKFAAIISELSKKEPVSGFEKGIKSFSFLITRVVIVLCSFIFIINTLEHHGLLPSLVFSLALAVGVTPELLPMIITVNLSNASMRMSKKGVIVKKLSAIENFGSMDILCTDKTGTLTEDKITVVTYVDINNIESGQVIEVAYLNSFFHTGTKTPLDTAIIEGRSFPLENYKKINEIPFDFERRRDSLVFALTSGTHQLITKGAPEAIIAISDLSDEEKIKAQELFVTLSTNGYRVLAVATRNFENHKNTYEKEDEIGMSFTGFIAFIDPAKKDVKVVLDELERKSIAIKIISGDHHLVIEKIAKEVGLVSLGTLDAQSIDTLSDDELKIQVEKNTIFSRVTPIQKDRIILALQSNKHIVGYMGDGINDAPALRAADVGISVQNAVDVAKDSADIVLITKNLDSLIQGVSEGRKTFVNTMKYIQMATSSNFGNMLSMTGASIVLPFLPMLPTQILLNNLIYDVSQLSLIQDTVEKEVIDIPNPWDLKLIKKFMIYFGLASSLFDFLTFFLLFKVFHLSGSSFQTGWFLESFLTQTFVIFFIRSSKSILKSKPPHIVLVISMFGAVALAWSIALSKAGALFNFTPLPFPIILAIIFITLVYFATVETVKYFFYKKA